MDTNRVYFGSVYQVDSIGTSYYDHTVHLNYVKPALVFVKANIFGRQYMLDLNTKEKYPFRTGRIPKVGTLHVSTRSLRSFNEVTKNEREDLPRKMIKQMGNKYLSK
ncbi:MAG: hypothetical protein IJO43_02410 [Bacilli bacterium]|nr:hypothetical protein [Bacilli bacterium]